MQAVKVTGMSAALRGTAVQQRTGSARTATASPVQAAVVQTRKLKVKDAPKPPPPPSRKAANGTVKIGGTKVKTAQPPKVAGTRLVGGTKSVGGTRAIKAIEVFSSEKQFRQKQVDGRQTPKILSRIEQLRLLSKLEQSGLLSVLEKQGVTLSKLEQSGLLSTAEKLGLISLLADRNFPGTLYALAVALLAAGPAAVYFLPDDSSALVAVQALVALTCIAGGGAAWGGATLLSTLQKS